MKVVFNKEKLGLDLNKTIYQCFICDKLFNWNKNCSWYGSEKQSEENPDKIKYFCSEKCSHGFNQ